MPYYYLSLLVISLVGGLLMWKRRDMGTTAPSDYLATIKTYRSYQRITLTCALISFGALLASIEFRLDEHQFDFGWGSVAFGQFVVWLFIYFGFVKPQLHECEKMLKWTTR